MSKTQPGAAREVFAAFLKLGPSARSAPSPTSSRSSKKSSKILSLPAMLPICEASLPLRLQPITIRRRRGDELPGNRLLFELIHFQTSDAVTASWGPYSCCLV